MYTMDSDNLTVDITLREVKIHYYDGDKHEITLTYEQWKLVSKFVNKFIE